MIRKLLLSLALVASPLASPALTMVLEADCSEDGVDYSFTEDLAPGVRYTTAYAEDTGDETEWLLLCTSGKGVRAEYKDPYEINFYSLSTKLAQSEQTYSLEEVAKLARENGYDARVTAFSPVSCVCKLDRW